MQSFCLTGETGLPASNFVSVDRMESTRDTGHAIIMCRVCQKSFFLDSENCLVKFYGCMAKHTLWRNISGNHSWNLGKTLLMDSVDSGAATCRKGFLRVPQAIKQGKLSENITKPFLQVAAPDCRKGAIELCSAIKSPRDKR